MATPVTHYTVTRSSQSRTQNVGTRADTQPATQAWNEVDSDVDDDFEEDEDNDLSDDGDSLVGVSMSRAQTNMKLPSTPAAAKAQAMQASKSYFESETDDHEVLFDEPLQKVSSTEDSVPTPTQDQPKAQSVPVPDPKPQPSSPSRIKVVASTEQKTDKRSSVVSSILGSVSGNTRPRSSSGSSIVENIRKRIPNLPSINLPRFNGPSHDTDKKVLGPAAAGVSPSYRPSLPSTQESHDQPPDIERLSRRDVVRPQVDGSKDDMRESDDPRKRMLRRATSDQSLYLRKAATGSSNFDDYTVFSDVSEMVNSRFKAITDSFQDSSFRRPKLLGTSQNDSRGGLGRTNSDEARRNTKMNSGSMQPLDMSQRDSESSPAPPGSKHPILKEALARMTGDLVIMGGYRGSVLRDAETHRQLWVPIKVGMNLRKADLEVGLTRDDELRMEKSIIADGVLSHIGPVDICRRLLRKCRRCSNVQSGKLRLHDYGYDWRLSPDILADRLIQFLSALPCNKSDRPLEERGAWLISHSLGGLLTRHIINRRPDLVAGVVYAGTPQNCVNILGPLRNGDDVLFSSRVLTAQVNFTLRTSYALLPENGRCFINKQTGERYDVNFFDPKTWDEYRLSPCIKQPLHYPKQEPKEGIMSSISMKRMSWFGSTESSRPATDSINQIVEKAEDAAEAAKPERPLSPSMDDSSSRNYKPSVATTSTIPLAAATEYLERTLTSVLKFKQELKHRPSLQDRNAYPPAAVLFAKNTPTVYGAFVTSREAIKYDNAFSELAFAQGDGVVLASAAQLPTGYKCVGRVESDRGHVGLLGDLEGVGKCLLAIMKARSRGVGKGANETTQNIASDHVISDRQVSQEKGSAL